MRAAVILGAMLVQAPPTSARPVVAVASGAIATAHPPGSQIDDDEQVVLRAGDELLLITRAGTVKWVGPKVARLNPDLEPGPTVTALLALPDPVQMAALPPQTAPPGVWTIDIARSDTVCIADRLAIALWRSDTATPLTLQLLRRGAPTDISFAAAQSIAMVPPAVAVADNDVLTLHGLSRPVTLTVRMIRAPRRLDGLAAALVKAGCQGQLSRLAARSRLFD